MRLYLSLSIFCLSLTCVHPWVVLPAPAIRPTRKHHQQRHPNKHPNVDSFGCSVSRMVTNDSNFQMTGTVPQQSQTNNDNDYDKDDELLVLPSRRRPHLIFPGGGIFFYWQAGVVTYLREQGYDMTIPTATGASAGALTATLMATDVDFYRATELALELAENAGVWNRKQGLQGIWGDLIYEWLDELLPEDAVDHINMHSGAATESKEEKEVVDSTTRLSLLVTPVQQLIVGDTTKDRVSQFTSREDLIQCNMASIHIPWFLDGKITRNFRERAHIDGSFLARSEDYHPRQAHHKSVQQQQQQQQRQSPSSSSVLTINHNHDSNYKDIGLLDFVNAVSPEGIYGILEDGKKYAQYLEETGRLHFLPKIQPEQ